jgi:hypothetical protein
MTVLLAGIAALAGLLADWLEHPPTVVALLIAATVFGALVAGEVSQDDRRSSSSPGVERARMQRHRARRRP